MKCAYGLDLAGYSSRGSALAKAVRSDAGEITVTILQDCCFAAKTNGHDRLDAVNAVENAHLAHCCTDQHPLIVDVPIDLQGLPAPDSAQFVWELIRRPVDRAFGALPPLADQIGAYVARMRRLWNHMCRDGSDPLGTNLFETYPAAILELLDLDRKGYKGQVTFDGKAWLGRGAEDKQEQRKNDKLAIILTSLGWTATTGALLGHDEFDAAICALVGVADDRELLYRGKLADAINDRLRRKKAVSKNFMPQFEPPRGYVLLSQQLPQVHVKIESLANTSRLQEEATA